MYNDEVLIPEWSICFEYLDRRLGILVHFFLKSNNEVRFMKRKKYHQ
jgi:hypothetical protein